MNVILSAVSFLIGTLTTIQSGMNGQLRLISGNPIFAAFTNFVVGAAALSLIFLILTAKGACRLPSPEMLRQTKWWMWCGGPLGVLYIVALVIMPALIGYASFFSMLVAGQLIASVAADHTGFLGISVQRVDRSRLIGVALLVAGAVIIQNT